VNEWLAKRHKRPLLGKFSHAPSRLPLVTESKTEQIDRSRRSSTFVTDPESNAESSEDDSITALPALPPNSWNFSRSKPPRPFPANKQSGSRANSTPYLQVKDYMPPLWWAGRFQTRFDQWRHEAMKAELDPLYIPEGMLGHYDASQEKVAICYIFLQLRNLCTTNKAADSLWVSPQI
jgi:hypothetical protein